MDWQKVGEWKIWNKLNGWQIMFIILFIIIAIIRQDIKEVIFNNQEYKYGLAWKRAIRDTTEYYRDMIRDTVRVERIAWWQQQHIIDSLKRKLNQ